MVSLFELSRFEGDTFPHMAHHTPLFSQRACLVSRHHGHHISANATSGTAPFRRKATPHPGDHNFLYHDGSLITCVALQGHVLSQSLPHTNTQDRISFGEKRCHSKHPNKIPLDSEIKERLWKNTLCATISIGMSFSYKGNDRVSFNLTHTSCPLRRHGCPAGRTACNRHISRERPRKSENLMQES